MRCVNGQPLSEAGNVCRKDRNLYMKSYCSQSQRRTTVNADLHNGGLSRLALRVRHVNTRMNYLRRHMRMNVTITTTMGQGSEDKYKVVGQGSIASLNACRLTVFRVCDGAVAATLASQPRHLCQHRWSWRRARD